MFFGNFIFDKGKNFVIVKLTQHMHVCNYFSGKRKTVLKV